MTNLNKSIERARNFISSEYNRREFSRELEFLKIIFIEGFKDHQIKAYYHLYLLGNGANFSVEQRKTSVVWHIMKNYVLRMK
jgi:hypothetical protein